ncbi:uncharacterized protein AB9W97_012866 [Spinachia spinachia]
MSPVEALHLWTLYELEARGCHVPGTVQDDQKKSSQGQCLWKNNQRRSAPSSPLLRTLKDILNTRTDPTRSRSSGKRHIYTRSCRADLRRVISGDEERRLFNICRSHTRYARSGPRDSQCQRTHWTYSHNSPNSTQVNEHRRYFRKILPTALASMRYCHTMSDSLVFIIHRIEKRMPHFL